MFGARRPRAPVPETLCSSSGRAVSTRIGWWIKTEEGGPIRLIARGDALGRNDPPFAENEMLGRVAAVVRGRKRIELDRHPAAGQQLLRWIVQHSSGALKWLLRWHSVRMRFARNSGTAGIGAELQPQESV